MKNLLLSLVVVLFVSCTAPVTANQIAHTGNVKECAKESYGYTLIVKYKDANISPEDVIHIIAPQLNLPKGWENSIERVVYEIYENDLTEMQVYERIYLRCIHGYSV